MVPVDFKMWQRKIKNYLLIVLWLFLVCWVKINPEQSHYLTEDFFRYLLVYNMNKTFSTSGRYSKLNKERSLLVQQCKIYRTDSMAQFSSLLCFELVSTWLLVWNIKDIINTHELIHGVLANSFWNRFWKITYAQCNFWFSRMNDVLIAIFDAMPQKYFAAE